MTTSVPFFQVDAFAERAFGGNPAAVVLLSAWPADEWLQAMAREMNLSETAFLVDEEEQTWGLRWLTPAVEVDLCGHATLAAAHVLWEQGRAPGAAAVRFETRSGELTARRVGDLIELDFPATAAEPWAPPADLEEILGVPVCRAGRSRFDLLVETESEAAVRRAVPDLGRLGRLEARGVILTAAAATTSWDFVSRFFAPAVGVDEDPVTGSAHCTLGPWWAARLGRSCLVGFQASARGGLVRVEVRGDRVGLAGSAVTVARGEILVPPVYTAPAS